MWNDLRFALRTMARAPVFTGVAVLSLALGIGANTAIFSLLYEVLMRSLPVADPESIAVVHFEGARNGWSQGDSDASVFSYPMYCDLRDRNQVFEGLIARSSAVLNQSIRINGLSMTVVGVAPRGFLSLIGGQSPGVYLTMAMRGLMNAGVDDLTKRDSYWMNVFGRLKPGVTPARAQASLGPIHRAILDQELAASKSSSGRFREYE